MIHGNGKGHGDLSSSIWRKFGLPKPFCHFQREKQADPLTYYSSFLLIPTEVKIRMSELVKHYLYLYQSKKEKKYYSSGSGINGWYCGSPHHSNVHIRHVPIYVIIIILTLYFLCILEVTIPFLGITILYFYL